MLPSQHRTPRATFTRALQRICRAISLQPIVWVKWKDPILQKEMGGTIHLLKLWAVGSWAEGLPYCGDLDLVVQHVKKKGAPVPFYIMQSTIAKRAKYVRVYLGTPQENTSGVPFPTSQLIWSRENVNWETTILGVKADPLANRQHRMTDDLPLRREQVRMRAGEDFAALLGLRDQGIITWEWIEGDSLNPVANTLHPTIRRRWETFHRPAGKRTGKVMEMVLQWLESNKLLQKREVPVMRMSSSEFLINSTLIRIGRPLASVEILKKEWCEQLVLVPHWTRRGPNGLWVIRRGLNHPGVMKPTFLSQQIIPYI